MPSFHDDLNPLPAARRSEIAARLISAANLDACSVVVGFDAFVDEMIRVVGERLDPTRYTSIPTMSEFGTSIIQSAGHSRLREIVVTGVHAGGCSINFGDGLAQLGVPVHAFATLGEPPHAAFASVLKSFRSWESWRPDPGRTLAYEFNDGKLMFCQAAHLAEFTPAVVENILATSAYAERCDSARLIALSNWSMYPRMTEVWRLLRKRVFTKLIHKPALLIDLVDPSGRAPDDVRAMMRELAELETVGSVTLSLNRAEASVLARQAELPEARVAEATISSLAHALRAQARVSEVIVHDPRGAALATAECDVCVSGPFCDTPKKNTGAGDRFNSGYAVGKLLQLAPAERLVCGCGCAGAFVRSGRSATRMALANFIAENAFSACEGFSSI